MSRRDSMKSDMEMAAELARESRPKRQRNPTTYYTDDKPNTFTTKRYRGQFVYGPSVPSSSYTARDETAPSPSPSASSSVASKSRTSKNGSSNNNSTKKSKAKNKGNKQSPSQPPQLERRRSSLSSIASSVSSSTNGNLITSSLSPPKKRGPGRPPKRAKSLENPALLLLGKVPPKTPVSSIHPTDTGVKSSSRNRSSKTITTYDDTGNNKEDYDDEDDDIDDDTNDNDDDDEEPTNATNRPSGKRKRGRPPKKQPAMNGNSDEKPQSSSKTKARSASSSPFSTGTSTSKPRTSFTSNRPSHGHATRRGGAALLLDPIEHQLSSPSKPRKVTSSSTTTTTTTPTSGRGRRGMKREDESENDDDRNTTSRTSRRSGEPLDKPNRSTRRNGSTFDKDGDYSSSKTNKLNNTSYDIMASPTSHRSLNKGTTSHLADASSSPERKSRLMKSSAKNKITTSTSKTMSGIQDDIMGSFLSHPVTLAPILPPVFTAGSSNSNPNTERTTTTTTNNNDSNSESDVRLRSKFPLAFESGIPPGCSKTSMFGSNQSSSSAVQQSASSSSSETLDALPSWIPLYNPPIFFEDDYNPDSGILDLKSTLPVVSRKITAVAVRQPQHDYLVLGDSIGFVTVYSLLPGTSVSTSGPRPVARLESVACQQRGRVEQERVRADILKRRKGKGGSSTNNATSGIDNLFYSIDPSTNGLVSGLAATVQRDALGPTAAAAVANEANTPTAGGAQQLRSIMMNTTDTNIHALAMIGNRVVLATQIELECMDVPSGTSLWVCPLSANRIVSSLDMHLSTYDVLVSCSKPSTGTSSEANSSSLERDNVADSTVSPLMLLQHSEDNVEICDANSPMLVRSPSCTAIWDTGNRNRLLFVALSSNRQELELVLVSGGSIDTWKVACKTKIPSRTQSSVTTATTKLSQSVGGHYTLVACTRGIRLYETETLQLIHVYGDQLSLHGQSVQWKDCWLAGTYFPQGTDRLRRARLATGGTSSVWLESDDWVTAKEDVETCNGSAMALKSTDASLPSSSSSSTPALSPYIIGVPHAKKGPKELCEKLHVWKVEQAGVVPALSIPLPSKGDGALGLVGAMGKSSSDDGLVLVTNDGQGHLLLPKLQSNFAGTMYPPGYQVVTDSIEYIENEDALDEVIQFDVSEMDDVSDEEASVDVLEQDDEYMDEELREAMRQSLLEHKKHKDLTGTQKTEEVIDILSATNNVVDSFLPCRPEPYLRQAINLKSDYEKEEEEGSSKEGDKPDLRLTKAAEVPKSLPGVAFVSNVLASMPNKEERKESLDEDCLSFTTTKVVMTVNPVVAARPGRGRKGRAGNLDALIKSSVNPYLQSLMLSKQAVPSDGSGSRAFLHYSDESKQETNPSPAHVSTTVINHDSYTASSKTEINKNLDDNNDGRQDARPEQTSTPTPQPATNDEADVALGLLGLSPCNSTRPTEVSTTAVPTLPAGPATKTEDGPSKDVSTGELSSFARSVESSVLSAINSPLDPNVDNRTEFAVDSSNREGTQADPEVSKEDRTVKVKPNMQCLACRGRHVIHTCGKRSLPIDYDEVAKIERERKAKEEEEKRKARAEKRRLADQRRRDAKKQKQMELEQQRIREVQEERIEVERQQRLQEDFASHDLHRLRRDQIVASYATHLSHMRDPEHQPSPQPVSRLASAESSSIITPSARHPESLEPSHHQSQSLYGKQNGSSSILGRPITTGEVSAAAPTIRVVTRPTEPPASHAMQNGAASAVARSTVNDSAIQTSRTLQQQVVAATPTSSSLPSSPPRSATLASADALVALATFAGASEALATSPSPAPTKSVEGSLSSFASSMPQYGNNGSMGAAAAPSLASGGPTSQYLSHGFSASLQPPVSDMLAASHSQQRTPLVGDAQRSIPSYAAIRGQMNGHSLMATHNQTVDASNSQAVTVDSLSTGSDTAAGTTNTTTTVETYVWPDRRDATADAAIAMASLSALLMGNSNGGASRPPQQD